MFTSLHSKHANLLFANAFLRSSLQNCWVRASCWAQGGVYMALPLAKNHHRWELFKTTVQQIGSLIFFVPPEVSHLPPDRVRIDGERAHSPKVLRPPSSVRTLSTLGKKQGKSMNPCGAAISLHGETMACLSASPSVFKSIAFSVLFLVYVDA